ncbi:MAG: NitT/TauT family transport system ATP-binding protein [Alphaproteobacteria bacterium]|jgi:NitT/TauT family transport system ATP-binding protein|nr:NitT/TauT family transport system ATP-binding protein [Alphaproteobacteria bacterium]
MESGQLTAAGAAGIGGTGRRPVKIRIKHLIKRFRTLVAIDDVSIDIEEGTFFAIVGPSGCGKTTMLRILGGLESLTGGEVEIADPAPGRPQYSMIFQGDSIFPWMTVWENAAYGLRMRKAPKAVVDASVALWLDRTGLTRYAGLYPYQLSGGMRQRVSIARAFANDPEVLLMDEPFSALDEQNRTILQQELLRIWEVDKKTVVFITHSVDEAVTLADKIMVMTASPGRAKSIIDVTLERPRNVLELRNDPRYGKIVYGIWGHLKDEVERARL